MSKIEKENLIENMRHIFNSTKEMYNNSSDTAKSLMGSINDTYISYIIKIKQARKSVEVQEIFSRAMHYISIIQTDLAMHNLKRENII